MANPTSDKEALDALKVKHAALVAEVGKVIVTVEVCTSDPMALVAVKVTVKVPPLV